MPRIGDDLLDCAVYLYPSRKYASDGEKIGGSGFLVGIPSEVDKTRAYHFVVTNSHVIIEANSPVVRINTVDGQFDVLEYASGDWFHHPDGDDIAVLPISLSPERYKYNACKNEMFLTKDIIEKYKIGPGDGVVVVGRFINHEGKQRNIPSVRFGNISMMPSEPIMHGSRGIYVDSFLVEARTIAGYSGSPVFIYISPFELRPQHKAVEMDTFGPWLLGVDWGIILGTGMMCVAPAWKLSELLDIEKLKTRREREDKRLAEGKKRSGDVIED